MAIPLLSFGDVFVLDEADYVYLAATADVTYAARILQKGEFQYLRNIEERKIKNGTFDSLNVIYCYVVLETDQLKDRAISLARTEVPGVNQSYLRLSDLDIEALKAEIITAPVAPALKKAVARSVN